jgi:hypothetical protein
VFMMNSVARRAVLMPAPPSRNASASHFTSSAGYLAAAEESVVEGPEGGGGTGHHATESRDGDKTRRGARKTGDGAVWRGATYGRASPVEPADTRLSMNS